MPNIINNISFLGLLSRLGDDLSKGSIAYAKAVSSLSALESIDWFSRDFTPLNPLVVADNLIINDLLSDSGLSSNQLIPTHDGDSFGLASLTSIITSYSGARDFSFTLGNSNYSLPELVDSLSAVHQSSKITSFFANSVARGQFSLDKLNTFVNTSFKSISGESTMILNIISENFDPRSVLSSSIQIVRLLTDKMSNGTVSGNTIDFDQTDYTITSIWQAISAINVVTTLLNVVSAISAVISPIVSVISAAVSSIIELAVNSFKVDFVTWGDADESGMYYSIPIFKRSNISVPKDSVIGLLISDFGSLQLETSFIYCKIWPSAEDTSNYLVNVEVNPSVSGSLHRIIIDSVDGGVTTTNFDTCGSNALPITSDNIEWFSGSIIRFRRTRTGTNTWNVGITMETDSSLLLSGGLVTANKHINANQRHYDSISRAVYTPPVRSDHMFNAAIAWQNIFLMSVWPSLTIPQVGYDSNFISNIDNASRALWSITIVNGNPTYIVNGPYTIRPSGTPLGYNTTGGITNIYQRLNAELLWENSPDSGSPVFYRQFILSKLTDNTSTASELNSAWQQVYQLATDLIGVWMPYDLLNGNHYSRIDLIFNQFREKQFASWQGSISPIAIAPNSEDFKRIARRIVTTAALVVVAVGAFLAIRAINRAKLRRSYAIGSRVDAASQAFALDPSDVNKRALNEALYRQERFFKWTGYLQGSNWGSSGGSLFPANNDDVIKLIV